MPKTTQAPFERLILAHLDVVELKGDVLTWRTHPTEAEQSFAAELIGRPLRHAVQ